MLMSAPEIDGWGGGEEVKNLISAPEIEVLCPYILFLSDMPPKVFRPLLSLVIACGSSILSTSLD